MQALVFSTHLLRKNKPIQTTNILTSKNAGETLIKKEETSFNAQSALKSFTN